jgi:hypothetical protein
MRKIPTLPELDPILVETVDQALEPYKTKLSPEMLEHFREEALVLMSTHPYPAALVDALKKRTAQSVSGERPKGGEAPPQGKRNGKGAKP